jgi:hypothetical protein
MQEGARRVGAISFLIGEPPEGFMISSNGEMNAVKIRSPPAAQKDKAKKFNMPRWFAKFQAIKFMRLIGNNPFATLRVKLIKYPPYSITTCSISFEKGWKTWIKGLRNGRRGHSIFELTKGSIRSG